MTRRWYLALILLLAVTLLAGTAQANNPRYAGIVIDTDTSEILYAENADAPRYPASLTKMMTLYMLFETLDQGGMTLGQRLPVSSTAAGMPATKLWLKPGSSIPVEKAIQALVVRSANDVAVVVAEALGGSESHFARMMTTRAREMGMEDTTFRNASGLPDDRQVTTARDMALLARRLMLDFPQYYPYFSLSRFTWRGKTLTGHNNLLDSYPGADGLKTGFIRASGFNVATSAKRGGRRILSVVMGGYTAASRDEHMANLLDRGFLRASLSDGRGFLANTRITDDHLLPGARRPIPSSGQMLASADDTTPEPQAISSPSRDEVIATAGTGVGAVTSVSEPTPARETSGVTSTPEQASSSPSPSTVAVASAASRSHAPDPIRRVVDQHEAAMPGSWGVQVGAFSDADHARRLAARAAERLTAELADARVAVPHVAEAGVYRARLVDMQEGQARNACRRLQAQGMDCMVVQATL
ncbi:serine hydrolase [Halomonas sp. I1]|uniref:serine hydrolase n=1 Tax=Halomonas sp. I1 TaxID=393536 RepID=UPI0028DECC8C|nr:serine hydrolase [Halomonas sp. I1]MDT8893155.1 serine hydrolase [Halomonas sp. I1]